MESGTGLTFPDEPRASAARYRGQRAPRKLGALRGKIRMAADFGAPLPEEVLAPSEGGR
jgi:hypothetical protein